MGQNHAGGHFIEARIVVNKWLGGVSAERFVQAEGSVFAELKCRVGEHGFADGCSFKKSVFPHRLPSVSIAKAEIARELAYRLYTVCERRKRAAEAMAYNGLVQSWPEITRLAREAGPAVQTEMFEQG